MNDNPDYALIAKRIEAGEASEADAAHVAVLAGLEIVSVKGSPRIQSVLPAGWENLPDLSSVDDFERTILQRGLGNIDDIGRDEASGRIYASFCDEENGNDYGHSERMGRAFWAAYVRVVGRVHGEDDN